MIGRGSGALSNGGKFPILKVRIERYNIQDAVNNRDSRGFSFTVHMMNWTINGRTSEMTNVEHDEIVHLNT